MGCDRDRQTAARDHGRQTVGSNGEPRTCARKTCDQQRVFRAAPIGLTPEMEGFRPVRSTHLRAWSCGGGPRPHVAIRSLVRARRTPTCEVAQVACTTCDLMFGGYCPNNSSVRLTNADEASTASAGDILSRWACLELAQMLGIELAGANVEALARKSKQRKPNSR